MERGGTEYGDWGSRERGGEGGRKSSQRTSSIAARVCAGKLSYGTTSVLLATIITCLLANKGRIDSNSLSCWSMG